MMRRPKKDAQPCLTFLSSCLALTNQVYAKYESISKILDACPRILGLIHRDLEQALKKVNRLTERKSGCRYTSDNVLRILLVQAIEGLSLRELVVRIDDSRYFPVFTRLGNRPMMSFTHVDRLKNAIEPGTWKEVNFCLAKHAVSEEWISGEALRLDTTAVESNIHYPTDSSLLFDAYRVIARQIEKVREIDPVLVGDRRIRLRDVRRRSQRIGHKAGKKGGSALTLKPLYKAQIEAVERILHWSRELQAAVTKALVRKAYSPLSGCSLALILKDLQHFHPLAEQVVTQARRRVIDGEKVPNEEKIFSIFEEHTELLKRGKAGKPIEFGHMIELEQVGGGFITNFQVFEKKPVEYELVHEALKVHKRLFKSYPQGLTADKGYWENSSAYDKLSEKISVVSICKKGGRTSEEKAREHASVFRALQGFRAGIEGSISFLKRCFRLARCMNKGWRNFAATVGTSIIAHNLVKLARAPC